MGSFQSTNIEQRETILTSFYNPPPVYVRYEHTNISSRNKADISNIKTEILSQNLDDNCSVCQDKFLKGDETMIIECHHRFHKKCLTPWIKNNNTCPVCRYKIKTRNNNSNIPNNNSNIQNNPRWDLENFETIYQNIFYGRTDLERITRPHYPNIRHMFHLDNPNYIHVNNTYRYPNIRHIFH